MTLTIVPLHLLTPIHLITHNPVRVVDLSLEVRVHQKIGLAVFAGRGSGQDDATVRSNAREAGIQARYYFYGDFRSGAVVGGELQYFNIRPVVAFRTFEIHYEFEGYAGGPFVGYKWVPDPGITFEGQVGLSGIVWTKKDADDHPGVAPNLSLKVGWSL